MSMILGYIKEREISFLFFLLLVLLVIVLWNLYKKEKKRAEAAELSVAGERKYYGAFVKERKDFFIYFRKEDLRILYISPNFQHITGIASKLMYEDIEVLNTLYTHTTRRRIQGKINDWDKRDSLEFECDYKKRGSEEDKRACITVETTQDEEGYLLAFRDITEEYNLRQQIYGELQEAQRESQSKTDFLSQMSHEIRTPMNGILGMLSLMRTHIRDERAAVAYLDKTEQLSQFLLTLINDILDMSRIESGKMKLEKVTFDLYQMADKLDTMFRTTAEDKGIHWQVEMQDFDVRYVVGDSLRLSQVIINFISNANKFTPAGGSVTVTFRQMDKIGGDLHFMIKVKDTGKGIKKDFISKIFRPFEQEDASTAHNYGGSGLGMAIADSLIKLMNGKILVESEEGKGSEFTVYLSLPIAQDMEQSSPGGESPDRQQDKERQKAIDEFTLEGLKILMAEDNDINAEIAAEILEMQGVSVTRAVDGEEVIQMFEDSIEGYYDVILMDIQMPKLDGWEATKKIRDLQRADADILIFAMSANAFLENQRHSLEVGMNGHISKPVDFNEVRELIGTHMYEMRSHKA